MLHWNNELTMYFRFLKGFAILAVSLSVISCTTVPRTTVRSVAESNLVHPEDKLLVNDWMKYKGTETAHLIRSSVCGPRGKKTAFFITLSGGGSRAAYFGARVIHELDRVGTKPLTSSIDGIFSVSGGSLAATLYGISRDDKSQELVASRPIWSEELTDKVLSKPLAFSMANEFFNPSSLASYLFSDLSRTDLLEKAIEKEIFGNEGKSMTFQSLNPDRPPIYVIAAIATSEGDPIASRKFGSPFIFAPPDLTKLGDDLMSVPIAMAASASAAFPGLLSPVTLPRYRRSFHETQVGIPRFVHLIDGGNADNLGLLGVKRALLEDDYRLLRDCESVVVLSVDAFGRQGVHNDSNPYEASAVGWVFDYKSALASFDALLAANRARLLGEFKSRILMPPGSEELCEKDGLPDEVCGGGVRADWGEINRLIKQKLYFVHLNFDSPEMASQKIIQYCDPDCEVLPVDDKRLYCEQRQLRDRARKMPTTFGLSSEQMADLRVFVSSLNHPNNACLSHLWDVVAGGEIHDKNFYEKASASCDETPTLKRGEVPIVKAKGHIRGRIFGDVVPSKPNEHFETVEESCDRLSPLSHEERMRFLYEARSKLIGSPQYLNN
jgi:predicted acylesterase/phospholipase RssA